MSAAVVHLEMTRIGARTRRSVGVSVVAHALLLLALVLTHHAASDEDERLVEIAWLEPVPAPPAAPAAREETKARAENTPARPAPREQRRHFPRPEPEAKRAPRPQELAATRDALRSRLASLQKQAPDRTTQVATLAAVASAALPNLAGLPDAPPSARPAELTRGQPDLPPVELTRAPASARPVSAPLRLREKPSRPKPSSVLPASASRKELLSGITLAGPVADRALVRYAAPEYPEWAKREAVEGFVRLHFEVLPDGRVKEDVLVQTTSGYEDFDRNAVLALLSWRFEPLEGGAVQEQWGSITLDYRLADAQ